MSDHKLGDGLPNFGGLSLSDLGDKPAAPTSKTALDMLLSDQDPTNHGFNNYI